MGRKTQLCVSGGKQVWMRVPFCTLSVCVYVCVCVCVCVRARARARGKRKHTAKEDFLSKTDQGVRQLSLQERNNPR